MKSYHKLIPLLAMVSIISLSVGEYAFGASPVHLVSADASPTSASLSSKMTIDLSDSSESEIRSYYSSLDSLSVNERSGTNLLKNLKPILQDMRYYSYSACWKIYEITDRDWSLSPASETAYGTYDASSQKITDYEFGSTSEVKNNPYLRDLYKNRDESGSTVEEGRIQAWNNHGKQTGGTDREHVWCQSRGFKDSDGASGPAGTDVHHLMPGDSYVNQAIHNNRCYGNVKTITLEASSKLSYCKGNQYGTSETDADFAGDVFEPQDSDKGDIARACFYMVACYNNLAGESGVITAYNPNLELVNHATNKDGDAAVSSSDTEAATYGILQDLLEWNELDPVDEFEIHRNNLIYSNFQHNRNPFVDFPEWANYIWGTPDDVGVSTGYAAPSIDTINGYTDPSLKPSSNSSEDSVTSESQMSNSPSSQSSERDSLPSASDDDEGDSFISKPYAIVVFAVVAAIIIGLGIFLIVKKERKGKSQKSPKKRKNKRK